MGFLKSPEWSVPVMEFIDKQCIVFDIIDIPGALVPDLTLVPRSEQDITDDPNCN